MALYGAVTVGGTPVRIVSANPNRSSILIQNTDASVKLYIGPDSGITTSNGFVVPENYGSFFEDRSQYIYKGAIWGISSGSIDIRFWEREQLQ